MGPCRPRPANPLTVPGTSAFVHCSSVAPRVLGCVHSVGHCRQKVMSSRMSSAGAAASARDLPFGESATDPVLGQDGLLAFCTTTVCVSTMIVRPASNGDIATKNARLPRLALGHGHGSATPHVSRRLTTLMVAPQRPSPPSSSRALPRDGARRGRIREGPCLAGIQSLNQEGTPH